VLAFKYIRKIRVGCISEKIPVKFLTLYRNEKNKMKKTKKNKCALTKSVVHTQKVILMPIKKKKYANSFYSLSSH